MAANAGTAAHGELTAEWENARPFEEMPTDSGFNIIRNFMPGGKYYKMDFSKSLVLMKQHYGPIYRWPSLFGRPAMVTTHNPDDFERIFRNEGVWPHRPGLDIMRYHRSVYRADYFQGIEGVATT